MRRGEGYLWPLESLAISLTVESLAISLTGTVALSCPTLVRGVAYAADEPDRR